MRGEAHAKQHIQAFRGKVPVDRNAVSGGFIGTSRKNAAGSVRQEHGIEHLL
jgi:hypothetical protein